MVHRSLLSFGIIFNIFFIYLNSIEFVYSLDNSIRSSSDTFTDKGIYNRTERGGRSIFVYRKNGVRLDIRLVSGVNNLNSDEEDDRFPMPPIRDLGHCVIDVSTACIKDRIARYIDTLSGLDKITLFGSTVKLVKVRDLPKSVFDRRGMDFVDEIKRGVNEFFDKFALRITLPGWNKRREQNQIDFMFDDINSVEGRGKGGHHKHRKGGDEYKQMMMCMMIALKMNVMGMMGLAMLKGMMMSGISMMMTKAMLFMKLMEWMGGSSSGKVEKILLVTKASGDDSGGGWHGPPSHSSYGAPPSSPSSGHHGGGGWGRSLNDPSLIKTSTNVYSQINNSHPFDDNYSIINSYPEPNRSHYSRSVNNPEHVGGVYQHREVEREKNYPPLENENNKKIVDVENKL